MKFNHSRRDARFRAGELVLLDEQDRSLWGSDRRPAVQEPRDWEQIALLYRRLEQLTASPIVTLSRAIAVAELDGPEAALELLDRLAIDEYRYHHATRADLLRRLGREDDARAARPRAEVPPATRLSPRHGRAALVAMLQAVA